MKEKLRIVATTLTIGAAVLSASCWRGNDMTQAEIDAANRSKPPTDAQMQVVRDAAARQAEVAHQEQSAWAKAHPDKVPQINAIRAKAGLPPLGG